MTARYVARLEAQGLPIDDFIQKDVVKVTQNRVNGEEEFRKEVEFMKERFYSTPESIELLPPARVERPKPKIQVLPNPLLKKKEAETEPEA